MKAKIPTRSHHGINFRGTYVEYDYYFAIKKSKVFAAEQAFVLVKRAPGLNIDTLLCRAVLKEHNLRFRTDEAPLGQSF